MKKREHFHAKGGEPSYISPNCKKLFVLFGHC
jgi:hypothetical protein